MARTPTVAGIWYAIENHSDLPPGGSPAERAVKILSKGMKLAALTCAVIVLSACHQTSCHNFRPPLHPPVFHHHPLRAYLHHLVRHQVHHSHRHPALQAHPSPSGGSSGPSGPSYRARLPDLQQTQRWLKQRGCRQERPQRWPTKRPAR